MVLPLPEGDPCQSLQKPDESSVNLFERQFYFLYTHLACRVILGVDIEKIGISYVLTIYNFSIVEDV